MKIDFALVNGNVHTFNSKDDTVEAVAVVGGKIVCMGTTKSVEALLNKDSKIIDVQGKTVLPGFVESHCHPSMAGLRLCFEVDVRNAHSIDEIVDLLRQKAELANAAVQREILEGESTPRRKPYFDQKLLSSRTIMTVRHCFGCTAGCGSSCPGAVVKRKPEASC